LLETSLDEIPQQGPGHLAVLRISLSKSQNLLLSLEVDAQSDQDQMVAQMDPVDHHDREVAIPQRCRQPTRHLLRRHRDVATRIDEATRDDSRE